METTEELQVFLTEMVQPDVWGQLIARGSAWSLMRQGGVLPDGSPAFGATIETDLAEHAFSILRGALALRERGEALELAGRAFERAANAFESLIRNGDVEAAERGFYRTIAAAAYHLASYSAIAYSLFSDREAELNTTPGEDALALLILRDLGALRSFIRRWLRDSAHGDAAITAGLAEGTLDGDNAVQLILNGSLCRALAYFDFALQTGEASYVETARANSRPRAPSCERGGSSAGLVDHPPLSKPDHRSVAAFAAREPPTSSPGRRRGELSKVPPPFHRQPLCSAER